MGGEPGPGHHPASPDLHQRGRGLGGAPWDLASLGYYYTGQLGKALEAAQKAAELAPDEPPIQANLQLIQAAQPAG